MKTSSDVYGTLAAIFLVAVWIFAYVYALIHAWRSHRTIWFFVILLFAGLWTLLYLLIHIREPMPASRSQQLTPSGGLPPPPGDEAGAVPRPAWPTVVLALLLALAIILLISVTTRVS